MLELVEIIETGMTDEEAQTLHYVIAELGDYIRRTAPTREGTGLLLLRARQMLV